MKRNNETKVVAVSEKVEMAGAKTLRELGMDGGLAAEFELTLRMMGAVKGDRVVGYSFTTPDGQRHALRVERGENQALTRAA